MTIAFRTYYAAATSIEQDYVAEKSVLWTTLKHCS
jgi:hypothetical protein